MHPIYGVYPTMITPYRKDGSVDYDGIRRIVDWYDKKGCHGIFAVCQSSEMAFLSLDERVKLAETVMDEVKAIGSRMTIVASGHISDDVGAQVEEIRAIHDTGVAATVLVSNRLDQKQEGDAVWIRNAESLLAKLPTGIQLGIYECPLPYKRLLTKEILDWCIQTQAFSFIKDTCCDPVRLRERLEQLEGSTLRLFNANAQTLLYSMKLGGAGYSGIMANFQPELYVWLYENFKKYPKRAQALQNYLSLYAFTEDLAYPVTAKYHMNCEGVPMELISRSRDMSLFKPYDKLIIDEERELEKQILSLVTNLKEENENGISQEESGCNAPLDGIFR